MNKKNLGKLGEELAITYLKSKEYKIITRNFRTRFGEIDIVCEKGDSIVFIEVRTKSNLSTILPEESITKKKIEKYKKLALEYLEVSKRKYKEIKFEFLGIEYKNNKNYQITHIENFID